MKNVTTISVIGLGAVYRNIHLPAYRSLRDRARIIGGCDPDPGAREYAHRRWGLTVFKTPGEMLAARKPDIVAVCTPPWMHREHVLLALEHGCHVFCEKPVAENLAETDEMILASEAAGRMVVVNSQFPCMRIHAAAKQMIGSSEFGELLYLHAWHTMRTDAHTEAGWRGRIARRLSFEFGIHVFELVRYFFGAEPVRLHAHMPNPLGRASCDVVNLISLEFADGRAASVMLDRVTRGPDRYLDMRLDGEAASIHTSIGGQLSVSAGLRTREKRPFLDFRFVKGGQAVLEKGSSEKVIATDGMNPFASATAAHFSAFLESIASERPMRASIRDNRRTLALVMASYDSAASGEWIPIASGERIAAGAR